MGADFFRQKREHSKSLDSPFKPDHIFVYVILGRTGAELAERFTQLEPGVPLASPSTTRTHMHPITLNISGQLIRLELWNIPNEPQHRVIRDTYLPLAHAVFICADLSKENALEEVEALHDHVKNLSQQPSLMLVGTQFEHEGTTQHVQEFQAFAETHHMIFATASIQTIDQLFEGTTERILEAASFRPSSFQIK